MGTKKRKTTGTTDVLEMTAVLRMLPKLTKAQLKKTRALINDLLSGAENGPDEEEVFGAWRAITERLPFPTLQVFRRMTHWKAFTVGLSVCTDYIDDNFRDIAKTRRMGIWRVLVDALIIQLQEEGIPIGPKVLSEHLKRVPEVMDYQFPGYREAGLLSAVVDNQVLNKRSGGDDGSAARGNSFDTDLRL